MSTAQVIEPIRKGDKHFILLGEIPALMQELGINRGFSRASINRKILDGTFNVKCIKSGQTRLWRPTDIISWWNSQELVSPRGK
tara:strand:+ start:281 stop:532 length:252 start_codon:yes stop_codon:yes gene_type:complete